MEVNFHVTLSTRSRSVRIPSVCPGTVRLLAGTTLHNICILFARGVFAVARAHIDQIALCPSGNNLFDGQSPPNQIIVRTTYFQLYFHADSGYSKCVD